MSQVSKASRTAFILVSCTFKIHMPVGQDFNVMALIGNWNFPSHYFSEFVFTPDRRAKSITSAKALLMQYTIAIIYIACDLALIAQ